MANRKQTSTPKRTATVPRAVSGGMNQRYPRWKVELFRAGISERQQSVSGQMSGRAMRAPGA